MMNEALILSYPVFDPQLGRCRFVPGEVTRILSLSTTAVQTSVRTAVGRKGVNTKQDLYCSSPCTNINFRHEDQLNAQFFINLLRLKVDSHYTARHDPTRQDKSQRAFLSTGSYRQNIFFQRTRQCLSLALPVGDWLLWTWACQNHTKRFCHVVSTRHDMASLGRNTSLYCIRHLRHQNVPFVLLLKCS
jgi:hypothetical protein